MCAHLGQFGFKSPHSNNIGVDLGISCSSVQIVSNSFGCAGDVIGVSRHDRWRPRWIHQDGARQSQRPLVNLKVTKFILLIIDIIE